MTKREMIASLIHQARQRSEDLDEGVDPFQDRSNWAAYVRQQLGESPELNQNEAVNADGTLNSIDGTEDRLAFAKDLVGSGDSPARSSTLSPRLDAAGGIR